MQVYENFPENGYSCRRSTPPEFALVSCRSVGRLWNVSCRDETERYIVDSAALPRQLDVAFTFTTCNPGPVEPKPVQTTKEFVPIQGQSRPGKYIGIASAFEDAYPIWIEGTHASMARIRR